jgi:DNA repair protein RecN (Recombination protein N)
LPQVAAYGDRHLVVDKKDDGSTVVSTVTKVEGEDRVRELTRMLAGQPDSASGNQHAAELLERAHLERSDK